jgi:hypothetical protein
VALRGRAAPVLACGIAVSVSSDSIHFKIHRYTLSSLSGSCEVRGEMLLVWDKFERENDKPFFLMAGIFNFRPKKQRLE